MKNVKHWKVDNGEYLKLEEEKIKERIKEKEKELKKYEFLKLNLYEDFKLGILKEYEYKNFTQSYSDMIIDNKKIISKLNKELNEILTGTTEKQIWIEHFKRYSTIQSLTRELVVNLIESIKVYKNKTIKIRFKYEDEYKNLLSYRDRLEVACNG